MSGESFSSCQIMRSPPDFSVPFFFCHMVMKIWVNTGSGNGLLPSPSRHYLNQCWLISEVQWQSPEGNFIRNNSCRQLPKLAWNYLSKFLFKSPRGKWVKCTDGCENYRSCMSPQTTKLLIWPLCEEISGHKYLFFILDDGMLSSIH